MALSILPEILFIQASLERAEKVLSQQPFVEAAESQPQLLTKTPEDIPKCLRQAVIPPPRMIDRLAEDMWRLVGDAGKSAAQMVSLLYQWNALVEKAAAQIETGMQDDNFAVGQSLRGHLKILKSIIKETEHGIKKIHP